MFKPVVFLAALLMGAMSFADQAKCASCPSKTEACKVEASMEAPAKKACSGCSAEAKADCGSCAKEAKAGAKECCMEGASAGKACCAAKMKDRTITLAWDSELNANCEETQEKAFWATTEAMLLTSEGGAKPAAMACAPSGKTRLAAKSEGACERSTATKMVKKGEAGCCNAKGEQAKFKVWNGMGYEFFGCSDSAAEGRSQLLSRGLIAGNVQPVVAKNVFVN